MVRLICDYACAVWSLYTQVNIHKFEMVQNRAAHFTSHHEYIAILI